MKWQLDDLPVFVAVVERGGVSAAARALGLSKSSVSTVLARLEQSLQLRLLERSTRSLRVTSEGDEVMQGAAPVLVTVSNEVGVRIAGSAGHLESAIAEIRLAMDALGAATGVPRFALFGICMPNFLLALLLIYLFGVTLHWLPISGYVPLGENLLNGIKSLTMPAITLGLALAAVVTRTLRSSLLETLSEDYVRTARAKGLAEYLVIRRHALKNGMIPVITILGLQLGTLIGGAVITEYIFALPGVGRLVVDAVFARDYPLVQGVILLIAIGYVLSNLVVDIVYGWLDPRIRYG